MGSGIDSHTYARIDGDVLESYARTHKNDEKTYVSVVELGDAVVAIAVDVSTRSIRNWIGDAREIVLEEIDDDVVAAAWLEVGMHDLRRTWATDCYYQLAFAGVPIAEQLTMSWGGWIQTQTGRETFRRNYLGPVPDHVTERAVEHLSLI